MNGLEMSVRKQNNNNRGFVRLRVLSVTYSILQLYVQKH